MEDDFQGRRPQQKIAFNNWKSAKLALFPFIYIESYPLFCINRECQLQSLEKRTLHFCSTVSENNIFILGCRHEDRQTRSVLLKLDCQYVADLSFNILMIYCILSYSYFYAGGVPIVRLGPSLSQRPRAWFGPKENTKMGLPATHHHPPPTTTQTF